MNSKETDIEDRIRKKLNSLDIFPFSIICTFCLNEYGLLALTFYTKLDLEQILEKLNYKNQCDKSGYLIKDTTLILTDLALINFYTNF